MRTSAHVLLDENLTGIRQVGDDLNVTVDEIHGMYDREALSLERIRGKSLMTTGTGLGAVWSLTQLRFQGRYSVFKHDGVSFGVIEDLPPLPGYVVPQPTYPVPAPPDWPTPDPDAPPTDYEWPVYPPFPNIPPLPYWPPYRPPTPPFISDKGSAAFSMLPGSLSFDETSGEEDWNEFLWTILTITVEDNFPYSGYCYILVGWDTDVDWLTVRSDGTSQGGFSSSINNGDVDSVRWDDNMIYYKFKIDEDKAPPGESSVFVVFIAVSSFSSMGRQVLRNPDGSFISTGVTITLTKAGNAVLEFVTASPTNIAVEPSGPAVSSDFVYRRVDDETPVYWRIRFATAGTWPVGSSYLFYETDPATPIVEGTLMGPVGDDDHHTMSMQVTPTNMVGGMTYQGDLHLDSYADVAGTQLKGTDTLRVRVTAQCADSFLVTMAPTVYRDSAFNVVLQAVDADTGLPDITYVPDGSVTLNLNSSDGGDSMTPVNTDETGWANGAKTVSCTITGGAGADTFAITASESGCPTGTSAAINVEDSTPVPCNACAPPLLFAYKVTFAGLGGSWAVMHGVHYVTYNSGGCFGDICCWQEGAPPAPWVYLYFFGGTWRVYGGPGAAFCQFVFYPGGNPCSFVGLFSLAALHVEFGCADATSHAKSAGATCLIEEI